MFAAQGSLPISFSSSAHEATIESDVIPQPLTAVSLYSGAGGLDLGFTRAGVAVRWAIDSDRAAVATYNENLGPHAVCGDVLAVDPPIDFQSDLLIGGPPCQGFSVIGRMDPSDPRSKHVRHFLEVVGRTEPRAFVMENVKALGVNPRWESVRKGLIERAEGLGYTTRLFLLNAQDFGVAQSRERMFLVGIKGADPLAPVQTTRDSPVTVRQVLKSLPSYGERGNSGLCTAKIVPASSPIMRPSAFNGSLLFNGSGRPLNLDAPAKTLPASMGGNATPILDQDEIDHGLSPWVIDYHQRLQSGGRPLKRVPKRLRRITVEEAAAIQSFPLDWNFTGPRGSQYRQIGNAVPPMLAEAVARSVVAALDLQASGPSKAEFAQDYESVA